jgi:TRAP-type uncharacterized transport system substrate-binding protein
MKPRNRVALIALGVIAASAALAALVHLSFGLLVLRIAVGPSGSGRQAASALAQVFSADHPRVRVKTVVEPDLLRAAEALDNGEAELAIVRSDAAPQSGQTLVILRRDAAVFVTPSGTGIDSIGKLRGMAIGILDGRAADARLLDLIFQHYDISPADLRRVMLSPDRVAEAFRHRQVAAVFVLAPINAKSWPALLAAVRRSGRGNPKIIDVDEAAAIAKQYPTLETLDVPKGAFDGSLPAPDDDVTTLSVSYRLMARNAMPDWIAAEITRVVLADKPKLMLLDEHLAGIEAPDPDDKTAALPIHSGTAAYLSGNLPSLSDQLQNAFYWLGLMASAVVSLVAASAALYHRIRPRRPPSRVMRLLELWLAARSSDRPGLDSLENEADALLEASVRADAHGQADADEVRLISLLVPHVREAVQRRRVSLQEDSGGAARA